MDFDLDQLSSDMRTLVRGVLDRTLGPPTATPSADQEAACWDAIVDAGVLEAFMPTSGEERAGAVTMAVVVKELAARATGTPALGRIPALLASGRLDAAVLGRWADGGGASAIAAVDEPARAAGSIGTLARRTETGYELSGVKWPVAGLADTVGAQSALVAAQVADGSVAVFEVDLGASGVAVTSTETGSAFRAGRLELADVAVPGDARLDDGDALAEAVPAYRLLDQAARIARLAAASGAMRGALALAAGHVVVREQFGKPLAQMQAVRLQLADAYLADLMLDTLLWSAAWQYDQGRADLAEHTLRTAELAITEDAVVGLYHCQHVHGGTGLDASYPVHRHVAAGLWLARWVGGRDAVLDRLGDLAMTEEVTWDGDRALA